MKKTQKKTCGSCKALKAGTGMYSCDLGHKIKTGKEIDGIVVEYIPQEPCYKPLTNSEWCEAFDLMR